MNKFTFNKRNLNTLLLSLLGAGLSCTSLLGYAQSSANYGYSAEGKLLGVTSNRDSIVLQWDALGRNSGKVLNGDSYLFGYNGQGLLTSYLDPKGLSTQYSYNGFGFPVSLSSPDTGFTSFTSNLAGAVTQKATSGSITNIAYDAEDRISSKTVSHPTLGPLTYSYAYGAQGSGYATGNLVSVSAMGQSISFEYNAFSDVTKKTQSVAGSATLSSQYSYSSPGLISGIAYPSGRIATYSRDAAGRISGITVDGTTIVSNVLYSPHGVAGWTFGNGNSVTRTFDLEGRITSVTLATGTRSYSYDARSNITAITDPVLGNATYGYDNQNRLISANTALGAWSYTYDANGSRTQLGMNGGNYAVMVDSTSNKALGYSTPTVRSLVYNNQGHVSNMTGDAATPTCGNSMQLGYNANGSLTTSTAFDAVYDDFGFRLRKTAAVCAGGTTTLFNYGLNGFIQGEYANDGTPIQETVWLGDIPVAVFRGIKSSESTFYIYTDNLNTPRQIMNNSSQLVWSWDGEPFGATPANGSVSPVTTFTYNLRFPGQYYDQETGYHQNRWREYDPKQGKYLQSDPLGLAAGVNTYAYVGSSPLMFIDPLGLIDVFIGGAWDQFSEIVYSYKKNFLKNRPALYFEWDDGPTIIRTLWNLNKANPCEPINIIGHSFGGSTAANVAHILKNSGVPIDLLITVDPVGRFSKTDTSGVTWININANPNAGSRGDTWAAIGGKWGTWSKGRASLHYEAPYNHEDFELMMRYNFAPNQSAESTLLNSTTSCRCLK